VGLEIQHFGLDDIMPIVDFLVATVIMPSNSRVDLLVNGEPVALSSYPREIIASVMETMVKSLKGVGDIKDIEFRLRKS
jgi:hypothetical protein